MIVDLLKKRFSVRKFRDESIPDDVLQDILEAGRLSPSGGNEQPWVFGVIRDKGLIAQIAEIAHRQMWMVRAPLLIVLCTVAVDDAQGGRDIQRDRFPEYSGAITEMEHGLYGALNQEEHQTKIAGTHMAMAALEHGVGSCWVSRFEVTTLSRLLNLPEGCTPSEILVLGFPDEQGKPAPKKRLEDITFYNRYPDR